MKKLLGILGTITIAGSGVSGIVGNVQSKNEINSLQSNNLETLKRNKRQNSNLEKENNEQTQNSNLENTNNYSLCQIVSALEEIWIKNAEELLVDIKNGLENLSLNDLVKLFSNKTVPGGEDKYQYRGVYHNFYLSHDTVSKISKNIDVGGGVASIISIIAGAIVFGPPGVIIGSFATLLVAQWKIWKAHTYDKGNGIIIIAAGFLPSWIVNIEAQ